MSSHEATTFAFQFVIGLGIALLVYGLLRNSLEGLLHEVVNVPAGTIFYLRSFLLVLLFVALVKVLTNPQVKPDSRFMECVWAVASNLSDVLDNLVIVLMVYLGLVTILVAVLRRKNAK